MIANAGSLFNYLQEINGIYSIPILTIIAIGYLTKKVPAIAAKVGIISGSALYILSQFVMKPHFVEKALEQANAAGVTDTSELALVEADAYPHYLHIMAILFILNSVIMLIIGMIRPRKEAFELEVHRKGRNNALQICKSGWFDHLCNCNQHLHLFC